MFRNYLITALRNLSRQKVYAFINISGLAIGLATCMVIMLYIVYELSYERFFEKHENVYRVAVKATITGDLLNVAVSSNPMGETMLKEFPELESFTRILPNNQAVFFTIGDKSFYNEGVYYVDSTFFDVFPYAMVSGNPEKVLSAPYSIVLSRSLATKYFGDRDPVGSTIRMNDRSNLTITGIMEDPPLNSHLSFNCLVSYSTLLKDMNIEHFDDWGSLSIYTYIRLADNASPGALDEKFDDMVYRNLDDLAESENIKFDLYLQPLADIHLHSNLMAEIGPNSDIGYIYTFGAIAFFALVIACINFMNLATARSAGRAREVGMRKVCGAFRRQIIFQFLGESILLAMLAMLLALIMVELSLPLFNSLTGLALSFSTLFLPGMLAGLLMLLVAVGIMAGAYPAFYISSFRPIAVIKGRLIRTKRSKPHLRNVLVVFQFTISVILIICTGVVYMQMEYLQHKRLGFEKENVVIIPLRSDRLREQCRTFDSEFSAVPGVASVSFSSGIPGRSLNGRGYIPEGGDENSPWIIYSMECDFGFVETMEMNILLGRDFDSRNASDTGSILINQTLMKRLGWEDPLGKNIISVTDDSSYAHKIIGVVEDFNFKSLHEAVEPALVMMNAGNLNYMIIKLEAGDPAKAIEEIRLKWEEMEMSFIFDYFMLDSQYEELYRSEKAMGRLFMYFAVIAVFIACLGLLGLASYTAEQRTKEIGIRKVLGATINNIIGKLSLEFLRWVLLANILSWPIAWYLMERWLENFAFTLSWPQYLWIFPAAGLISCLVALFTVSSQAYRAATTDPVKALKYE